jgi:hypothetical protein
VSVPITTATTSMTAKVTRYWVSATLNVNRGGTKMKSKAATLSTADATAGPRPNAIAVTTTPSR